MCADNFWNYVPFQKSPRTDAVGSDSGSREVGVGPKTGKSVVDGRVFMNLKRSLIQLVPSRDVMVFHLKRSSRSLDVL